MARVTRLLLLLQLLIINAHPQFDQAPFSFSDSNKGIEPKNSHSASFFEGGPNPQISPAIGPCNNEPYRSYDGTCNNLDNPDWGQAMTRYGRLIKARYADGVSQPTVSVTGAALPDVSLLSKTLFPDVQTEDNESTLMTMQFGQLISHDMSLGGGATQTQSHLTRCCDDDGKFSTKQDPTCFPFQRLAKTHEELGHTCMEFVRTMTDLTQGCPHFTKKAAEQLTAVTAWMDASVVYGNNQSTADSLRTFQGGQLQADIRNGKVYMPEHPNRTVLCPEATPSQPCYLSGDVRTNQNPQLTILQIVFLREHNRVAATLGQVNPHWEDERLYQEARRIVIAEFQHITYYEYVTLVLGREHSLAHGLVYETQNFTGDYNATVSPAVVTEHATAAFRFPHTNIPGLLKLISEGRYTEGGLRLSDHYNLPAVIEEPGVYDSLIRGLTTQSQMGSDQFFDSEVTEYLFRNGQEFGQDLKALDIQRGRDHGLASYNDAREFCGLARANNFSDFLDVINNENVELLSQLYLTPEDVELSVGGSLEKIALPAQYGPTYRCIATEQFYRTRVSDRYFYENGVKDTSFTLDQLNAIRSTSMARLVCDNGDNVLTMQRNAFLTLGDQNPLFSCQDFNQIPAIDLNLWTEVAPPTK